MAIEDLRDRARGPKDRNRSRRAAYDFTPRGRTTRNFRQSCRNSSATWPSARRRSAVWPHSTTEDAGRHLGRLCVTHRHGERDAVRHSRPARRTRGACSTRSGQKQFPRPTSRRTPSASFATWATNRSTPRSRRSGARCVTPRPTGRADRRMESKADGRIPGAAGFGPRPGRFRQDLPALPHALRHRRQGRAGHHRLEPGRPRLPARKHLRSHGRHPEGIRRDVLDLLDGRDVTGIVKEETTMTLTVATPSGNCFSFR